MAEKEDEKTDPSKDDELDALLDSALEDFEKSPSPCKQNSDPHEQRSDPGETLSKGSPKLASGMKDSKEPTLEDLMGLSESDIEAAAAEFEKSMKTILESDDELLKQWNEFAEKTTCNPGAANGESEHSPKDAEAFEAHLFKTMKDMAENAKEMTNTPEIDESFFKAMADMDVNSKQPDFNYSIFPVMQGMMMNLLSKEVLYPALDELRTKYPPWLKEKKSTLKSEAYENYSQQYKLVCEICSEYDNESEQDSVETKKERFEKLMRLMQQMQKYGQPPQELVGDRVPGFDMDGNFGEGYPPNKCPMM